MALAPCLLGYGAVAKMLHAHGDTRRDGNTFWAWIENYIADDYVAAVKAGSGTCTLTPLPSLSSHLSLSIPHPSFLSPGPPMYVSWV